MADGMKCVKARLVAKGFQDPGLKGGLVDTSGRVSLRSSHLQVVSLNAIRKWELRSLGNKTEFLRAGGFGRDVFLHAPMEWDPTSATRARKLKAPAYGLSPGGLPSIVEALFIEFGSTRGDCRPATSGVPV